MKRTSLWEIRLRTEIVNITVMESRKRMSCGGGSR